MGAKRREPHQRHGIDYDSAPYRIVCGQSQRYCTYHAMGQWVVMPVRMGPQRETICAGVGGPLVRVVGRVGLVVPRLALVSLVRHGGN